MSSKFKVEQFKNLDLSAPTIPGVGTEPGIVSAAIIAKQDVITKNLVGNKGVFAVVNKSVTAPNTEKFNIETLKAETTQLQSSISRELFTALKEEVEIEDYRASRY